MQPAPPSPRRRTRLLLVLAVAACSGCMARMGGGAPTPSDNTATGGASTVTEDAVDSAAPAAQTIGGTRPVPSGR